MKTGIFLVVASEVLVAACGQVQPGQLDKTVSTISSGDAYLLDTVESTASTSSDSGTTTSSSVAEDLGDQELKDMAARLVELADQDKSGSLSLDEFLASPEIMRQTFGERENTAPTEAEIATMKVKLTEQFAKYAGSDSLLSSDEIVFFLAASAPRVSKHRDHGRGCKKQDGRGGHGHGPHDKNGSDKGPRTWEDLVATYDKDGDGLLNKEEFAAFVASHHPQDKDDEQAPPQ